MDENLFDYKYTKLRKNTYMRYFMENADSKVPAFAISTAQEFIKANPESISDIHAHGYYWIGWFTEGNGVHEVDFCDYPVKPDTIHFLAPNQLHRLTDVTKMEGPCMVFSEEFLFSDISTQQLRMKYGLFNRYGVSPFCKVPKEVKQELMDLVDRIKEEYEKGEDAFAHADYLRTLVSLYLIKIKRMCVWDNETERNATEEQMVIFEQFRELLEDFFNEKHEVQFYVSKLHTTQKVLSASVELMTGTTPLKFINDRIIIESKRMLRNTPLRVKEIAQELGFEDSSYFVKFFKRQTGISPSDFRGKEE